MLEAPAVEWPPPLTASSMLLSLQYLVTMDTSRGFEGWITSPAGLEAAIDQRAIAVVYASGSDGRMTLAEVLASSDVRASMSLSRTLRR